MSQLKPKQIEGFRPQREVAFKFGGVENASVTTFASTAAIANAFIPEQSLIVEQFTGLTVSSSTSAWNITLSNNVHEDNVDLVTVFVNGVKLMDTFTLSATGNNVTMSTLAYDIAADDVIEVHYVEDHAVA